MSQISKYPISKAISDRIFEVFLKTLVEVKNREEADQFISDFLTPTEKIVLAKRLAIAFLLEKGHDYRTIQQIIRVSAPTITSVSIARKYGSDGYKKLISKILRQEKLIEFFDEALVKILAAPSALERGRGVWTYLKRDAEKTKNKRRRRF